MRTVRTFLLGVLSIILALMIVLTVSTGQTGAEEGAGRAPAKPSSAELRRTANDTRQLVDAVRRIRIFQEDLERTKRELLDAEMPPAEAGDRLPVSGEANNPQLFHFRDSVVAAQAMHDHPAQYAEEARRVTVDAHAQSTVPRAAQLQIPIGCI